MSTQNLYIPGEIRVGYQERKDTYTKKLAYVIYVDHKGVLRKEKSWEGWRHKGIEASSFQNEPIEGFVLNKGVGGQRQSYGWNARNEYIRVYDPRDFEFEISVSNLLFILRECDCTKGKGLDGKFVYAWDGTELVLLPAISTDYQESKKYTELQAQQVYVKDLIPGASYVTKKQKALTYVGRFNYHTVVGSPKSRGVIKKHVFWTGKEFEYFNDLKHIAALTSEAIHPDYAGLVDKYNKSVFGSKVVRLFLKNGDSVVKKVKYGNCWYKSHEDYWSIDNGDGSFSMYRNSSLTCIDITSKYYIKNGVLVSENCHGRAYKAGTNPAISQWYGRDYYRSTIPWVEPTNSRLNVELESGLTCAVASYGLYEYEGDDDGNDD